MNNKGQSSDMKTVIMIFVGAIIAIVLLSAASNSVFEQTNTFTATNVTVTVPAINVTVALIGRDLVGDGTVGNSSQAPSTNFTGIIISDGLVNGAKTVTITTNDTASDLVGNSINTSYTYNPDGYLNSSSDRSIAELIILFGALAAVVFVIATAWIIFTQFLNMNGSSNRKGRKI